MRSWLSQLLFVGGVWSPGFPLRAAVQDLAFSPYLTLSISKAPRHISLGITAR